MLLCPYSACTTLIWDHCHLLFRSGNNSFLTGLQNLQNLMYLDRIIFLTHCFYRAVPLFQDLAWLSFPTRSKLLGLAFQSLQDLLNLLPPQSLTCISCSKLSPVPPPGLFLSPIIYWTPSPSCGCPSPFQIQSSFLIISLMKPSLTIVTSETLFHLMSELCTLPLNHIFFCPLIVSCMYILSLNYILTFTSQEHVFSLCCLCRNNGVSTEAELSEHLLDALFRWAHVEKEDGSKWGF